MVGGGIWDLRLAVFIFSIFENAKMKFYFLFIGDGCVKRDELKFTGHPIYYIGIV